MSFKRRSGWLNTGLYLKSASLALMKYRAKDFSKKTGLPHPLSLTRTGLPRIIPPFHRKMIREGNDTLVRVYFSISRVILVSKKSDYQYSSIVKETISFFP